MRCAGASPRPGIMYRPFVALAVMLGLGVPPTFCAPLVPVPPPLPADNLVGLLRKLLLANLPDPLIEKEFNWGTMKEVPVGVKWKREGRLLPRPEVQLKLHNDGVWRRVKVTADAPAKTLQLGIGDLRVPEEGKLTFLLNVALPVHLHFEQQIWKAGERLYSGSTRARCRVGLHLNVESVSRLEANPKSFFPDVVFRVRVTDARLTYDNVVVEHTLGVGGDAAKILGDALLDAIKQWKPSLERDLLIKANKAIIKAGDTKEVRISITKLLQGQKMVERQK
jgi:hypothetical protein